MRILAVDLSHIARMQWEGAGNNKSVADAFNGALGAIVKARDGFDRTVVCCDAGPSFRRLRAPEYKADRTDPGEAYRDMARSLRERLAADGCAVVVAPRIGENEPAVYAEADDVIGWVAAQYCDRFVASEDRAPWHLRILSGDSDLEQLVSDARQIDIMKPLGMVGGGGIWTEATVLEKRGVKPSQIVDLKALAGDSTDNYKPFPGDPKEDGKGRKPGIGDEGAKKLLALYGDAMSVFSEASKARWDADKIPPAMRYLLEKHGVDAAAKGLFLATLRTDLPLDFAAVLAEPVVKPIAPRADYFPEKPSAVRAPSAVAVVEDATFEPAPPRPAAAPTSTAMARADVHAIDPYALQPRDLGEVETVAAIVMDSRAYGFSNPAQVIMTIIEARERGVPVGAALRGAYNVRGKLAWSASYLAALILASGKAEHFEIVETTSERAVLAYQRKGRPAGEFVFTIDEARDAGFMKSGERGDNKWITNPRTMLRWAAIREAARAFFPDVVSGMYTPDELRGHATDDDLERGD